MSTILKRSNELNGGLYDDLIELKHIEKKNIEVYKCNNITNKISPQTALKIYEIRSSRDETEKILTGILDVSIDEFNSIVEFYFYNVSKPVKPMYAFAKYINGEWDSNDGTDVPRELPDFNLEDIEKLINDIIGIYC